MNGVELNTILERLSALETRQEERHKENLRRMAKLDDLPCDLHKGKFKIYDHHVEQASKWHFTIVSICVMLVMQVFAVAYAWGQMQQEIRDHIKYTRLK